MHGRWIGQVAGGCLVGLVMTVSGVMASDGCLCATARGAVEPAPSAGPNPAVWQSRPAQAGDIAMAVTRDGVGLPEIRWTVHGLTIRKVTEADGRFEIQISAGADEIALSAVPGILTVSKPGRKVAVHLASRDESALDQARSLLANSKAVRQFRAMAYGMSAADASSPAGAGLQVTATFLSLLDGDLGAARRLADRGRQSSRPAPAGAVTAMSDEEEVDGGATCYEKYRDEVVAAWVDYESCCASFFYWQPLVNLCGMEWALKVESAWFQFLGCSSVPIR